MDEKPVALKMNVDLRELRLRDARRHVRDLRLDIEFTQRRIADLSMKPDIALEGVDLIMAKSPDGNMGTPVEPGYIAASGTSFACPIGACLAAMILQSRGVTTPPAEVAELLRASAQR